MSSRRDYTCVGSPVNVAQRLESTCPADAVQIGDETFRRIDPPLGDEGVERREGLRVKGVEAAITAYVIRPAGRS